MESTEETATRSAAGVRAVAEGRAVVVMMDTTELTGGSCGVRVMLPIYHRKAKIRLE